MTTRIDRVIVVPVIRNRHGEILVCRMPEDRGVYPGTWGLPGGGMEPGETMRDALHREVREELGLTVVSAEPVLFKDAEHPKLFPDGSTRTVYMIFLAFDCRVGDSAISLSDEFEEYAWVPPAQLDTFALNAETRDTLGRLGVIVRPSES